MDPAAPTAASPTKEQLSWLIRGHVAFELYDDSPAQRVGIAVYTLSDPRNIRDFCYVGQTRSPRGRFLQHLHTARLWLPDETPWWVRSPQLRPLYQWIRELYRTERRLPTMVVHEWANTARKARAAERARIHESLARHLPLFNIEAEKLRGRAPLL